MLLFSHFSLRHSPTDVSRLGLNPNGKVFRKAKNTIILFCSTDDLLLALPPIALQWNRVQLSKRSDSFWWNFCISSPIKTLLLRTTPKATLHSLMTFGLFFSIIRFMSGHYKHFYFIFNFQNPLCSTMHTVHNPNGIYIIFNQPINDEILIKFIKTITERNGLQYIFCLPYSAVILLCLAP